jgi:predicted MPP superfamily phosphohydrolase
VPFNPAYYLLGPSSRRKKRESDLPWEKLRDSMTAAGWLDLNNQRGQLTAGGLTIALAGVDDSHIKRDRYAEVAGPADAAADVRLGVMHSPEPRLLERARGLHRHPVDGQAWLHVSAGLGTSPWAPARFACRPEASLLTLVPRDSG